MNIGIIAVVVLIPMLLAGCANGPAIPEGQLSAAEIRAGAAPAERKWVEPLTDPQESQLGEARAAWSNNDFQRAQTLLNGLLEQRPDHPDLLANMAIVLLAENKRDEAKGFFAEALKVSPGHRVASNNLALMLKAEGNFIEARRVLARALEFHPDEPTLHYNLAVIYELYLQDLPKALDHYQRYQALTTEPDPKVAGWVADLERRVE